MKDVRLIYTCGCGDTDSFARSAYKLLFPDTEVPEIVHPPLNHVSQRITEMARALEATKDPFAVCFISDEQGLQVYDLLKGKRLA